MMYVAAARDTRGDKRETVDLWPEMARLLGVGRNAIYEAARRGDFRTIRIGKRILVPLPEISRLLGGNIVEMIREERDLETSMTRAPSVSTAGEQ